jgi:hypothetical protein
MIEPRRTVKAAKRSALSRGDLFGLRERLVAVRDDLLAQLAAQIGGDELSMLADTMA